MRKSGGVAVTAFGFSVLVPNTLDATVKCLLLLQVCMIE